ncbi:MAG: hypothetical protein ACK5MK_07385 [Dysgonomonas sp.]
MSEKKCPFCGRPLEEDQEICDVCRNSANERQTNSLRERLINESEKEEVANQVEETETTSENTADNENISEAEKPHETEKKIEKKKLSRTTILYLSLCVVVLVLGLGTTFWVRHYQATQHETETAFWELCVKNNTPLDYSKYLVRFPEGAYVEEARKRITQFRENEHADWDAARASGDMNKLYAFMSQYPESPFLAEARDVMDSISWADAVKTNTKEAYLAYLENVKIGNITGSYIAEAQNKYDYLSKLVTLQGAQLDSIKTTVSKFFKAVSDTKAKDIAVLSASEIKPYFGHSSITPENIVSQIKNEVKDKKIKELQYIPQTDKMTVIKDTSGIYSTDVAVNIQIKFKDKKISDRTETFATKIELTKDKKIKSISLINTKKQ